MDEERFSRNIGPINKREQEKLNKASIGVIGLGGVGSPAFEVLVRAGVGKFVIFDWDKFEYSNFNRQIYAVEENIGKFKVDAAAEKAEKINPMVRIEKYAEMLDSNNVAKLIKCDVIIDGSDNLATRKVVAKFCKDNNIPYVFCSAGSSMGMCGVFKRKDFGLVFRGVKEFGCGKRGVLGATAIFAGVLGASQAISTILRKPTVNAPEFLFFDIFSKRFLWKQKI